jgi:hypothetical protein
MDRIALVISDVDGTLVDAQKRVTDRTRQAVAVLKARGVGFTIVSSRPPFGLRMLIETLGVTLPVASFNGGAIAAPTLKTINQRSIDPAVAREIIAFLDAQKIEAWIFTATEWLTRDPDGAHVAHETHTVQQAPRVAGNFDAVIGQAGKIVGVSDDYARLEDIEKQAQSQFAGRAMAVRSQSYYLDFVAPGVDKGLAVRELAKTIGVPFAQIVTLGDMENDVPMFHQAGFSIAMGNASDAVKRQAREVTLTNDDDGFAAAVEKFILPRAGG